VYLPKGLPEPPKGCPQAPKGKLWTAGAPKRYKLSVPFSLLEGSKTMRAVTLLGLCLFGCATAPPPVSTSKDARAGIEEGNRYLVAGVLVGNGDRVATVYADDATILPFGRAGTIQGHVAIADYWRSLLANTHFLDIELTPMDISTSGDLAYEIGINRVKMQTGDAPPVLVTGRYLAVWRQGPDAKWRIQTESSIPDPPTQH
jgi:ketosteroid isomerase-like protein